MTGKRALIVDDDEALRALVSELLIGEGMDVVEAPDGNEGLAKARNGGFDVILLDVTLPGKDGYQIASQLTSTMGRRCPKILIMTGRDLSQEGPLALMTGARMTIQKPFELSEILEKLSQLLR